jgi:mono/diheme cytochrome c family protein
MTISITRSGVVLCALLFSSASLAVAQENQTQVKKAPIQRTSAASGEEMFKSYCAACHGADAKGDGPAATALKVPPADLTTLAKRHNGKYPADYVKTVLSKGLENAKAHGSKDMPTWGPLFGSIGNQGQASLEVELRISNLNRYLESLQSK